MGDLTAVVVLGIAAVAGGLASRSFKANRPWVVAAKRLDLKATYEPLGHEPAIEGKIGDVWVAVRRLVKAKPQSPGQGAKTQDSLTQYELRYASAGPSMSIHAHSEATADRTDRVETGVRRFDDHVFVGSPDRAAVRDYLTAARQDTVLATIRRWGDTVDISHDRIIVEDHRRTVDATVIERSVTRLVGVANCLRVPVPVAHPGPPQTIGRVTVQDDIDDADRIAENIAAQSSSQDEQQSAGSETPAPVPGQLPVYVPAASSLRLDQQDMIDDLFDGRLTRAQIADRFAENYVDRGVGWSGTITSIRGESRVVVLLGASGLGTLSFTEVFAVLRLQRAASVVPGQAVEFVGTITSLDQEARTFHINNVELEVSR